MECFKRIKTTLIFFTLFYMLLPRAVYAYQDLGTGSYIVQVAIASFLGVLYIFRLYWKKIIAFIKGIFRKNRMENDN